MPSGSTDFPGALDSFDELDNTDEITSTHQNDRAVAIEAVETKVGIGSSNQTPAANKVFGGDSDGHSSWRQVATGDIADAAITAAKLDSNVASGWILLTETLAYASATTITIATGGANRWQKGDRLRLKQGGGFKYFNVIVVADALITITGGSDYTLTNASITDVYVSREQSPFGWPGWFNYTPTVTMAVGATGALTKVYAMFSVDGGKVTHRMAYTSGTLGGTITGNSYSFSAAVNMVTSAFATNSSAGHIRQGGARVTSLVMNNGVDTFLVTDYTGATLSSTTCEISFVIITDY